MTSAAASTRSQKVDLFCDVLKLLRAQALSRRDITRDLGYSAGAIDRYCKDMQAHGLLVSWVPAGSRVRGRAARLFTVVPAFGGRITPRITSTP